MSAPSRGWIDLSWPCAFRIGAAGNWTQAFRHDASAGRAAKRNLAVEAALNIALARSTRWNPQRCGYVGKVGPDGPMQQPPNSNLVVSAVSNKLRSHRDGLTR